MSESHFGKYNLSSLSVKDLEGILIQLKISKNPKEIVEGLRFLHLFAMSGKEMTVQVLENGIVSTLSKFLQTDDENVRIESLSLFTVLALKNGKCNPSLISEASILMISNLLETADKKNSVEILEVLSQTFNASGDGTRPLVISGNVIKILLDLLRSKETTDSVKMNIITVVLNIIGAEPDGCDDEEENDSEEEASSSSSSSPSRPSSAVSQKPLSNKQLLAKVASTISSLSKSRNVSLAAMALGCIQLMERKFGENFVQSEADDGSVLKVQFDPDSTYVNLSGDTCVFNTGGNWRTVFLNHSFRNKIYRVEVKIISMDGNGNMCFGFCNESSKQTIRTSYLYGNQNQACVYLTNNTVQLYYSGGNANGSNVFSTFPFRVNSVIALELNMKAHTLHFFIDKKILPNYFQNVPSPLAFGITGYYSKTVKVLSLRTLSKGTVRPGMCTSYVSWV